ncbi:cupin domain-containing protein [Sedimentibacter saalensis]|uniref:cupin domain-containing protein n=1 Tax=Sedimentibacter saalensis TaxID=130788 RepID=UPI00289FCF12|nr:cupin domain-containing protein [Sedimentibacter saalensis]
MLEKIYTFSKENVKNIEKLIDDDNLNINHMILPKDAGLPEHYSNSNVYMIVVRGTLSLQLENHDIHRYDAGHIVNIPYNTKMNVNNFYDEILEFFVVKSPNPKNYQEGGQ